MKHLAHRSRQDEPTDWQQIFPEYVELQLLGGAYSALSVFFAVEVIDVRCE